MLATAIPSSRASIMSHAIIVKWLLPQAGGVLATYKAKFDEAPTAYTILAVLAVAAASYAYYKAAIEGLRGSPGPEQLFEMLNGENNILVVDVRADEDAQNSGLLDLTRGARGKVVALPPIPVRAQWALLPSVACDRRMQRDCRL